MDEWDRGRQYVSELDDLYDDLYAMLRGERPEKNYDWESNIVINKVFQVVWTAIPYITQKIFGSNPIIGISSSDKEGAWAREEILEFWNTMQPSKNHTPYFLIVVMWTLRALLNGVGFLKKSYHQKLKTESFEEQIVVPTEIGDDGKPTQVEPHTIKRKKTFPVEDWPVNRIVNNKDIVVDWLLEPTDSARNGRFVIHRSMLDLDYLKSSGSYINLDKIETNLSMVNSQLRQDHAGNAQRDGQETVPETDIYAETEVYERQGLFPVYKENGEWRFDKSKSREKSEMKQMIVTVVKSQGKEKSNNVLIRFEPNKYDEIGYVDLHIYLDAERWQSMGMVEPIKDLQTGLNDNINAMFDEIWANLKPPVVVNKHAFWDWDTMVYAPQQRWMMGGDPSSSIMFKPATNITSDAWQKHMLLDNEIQLGSSITPPMMGMGKEKAATTNVMNAQMSAGKLDFIVKMIEITGLIPSAQMDVRFAKKFTHPLTFQAILGKPFAYGEWEEFYKYIPAAASVKLEHQKETETLQDIQLLQTLSSFPNPKIPKILNMFLQNILRNRNWDEAADLLDEDFYEPQSDAGNMTMLNRMMGNASSNEKNIPMSGSEKGVRRLTHTPRGMNG